MQTIDEYILQCPESTQPKLFQIREIIKSIAPNATEKISWQMPTFYLKGNLVHFALGKNHIGFYPSPSGVSNFEEKLKEYKHSKGAIQFPLKNDLPVDLIKEITAFRVMENTKYE